MLVVCRWLECDSRIVYLLNKLLHTLAVVLFIFRHVDNFHLINIYSRVVLFADIKPVEN